MLPTPILRWFPLAALVFVACTDGGPVGLVDEGAFEGEQALTSVQPDLAPDPGTVGTGRYVPVLERILRRATGVIRERQGDEAAQRVVAEAQSLREAVRIARQAGDEVGVQGAVRKLETLEARVGLRVFGVGLIRHVHQEATGELQTLRVCLREAASAGQDVSRLADGAQHAKRLLDAARTAAGKNQSAAALIHAAHALDLVTRIGAAL